MKGKELLILGIGNDLLGDDAAGLLVAEALRADGLSVRTGVRSGLALLDEVVGARRVLLVDSQSTGGQPGTISEFSLEPSRAVRGPSAHYVGYGEALAIGAAVGLDMPEEVRVVAIERSPEVYLGADLSGPVRAALPALVERARAVIQRWLY